MSKENKKHEEFMLMAIKLSEENVKQKKGGPFGAVITKDDKLIAKSANTVMVTTDPTAHAEIATIRLACKELNTFDLTGCVIYTSCEPCPMCLGAIYWANLDKMYYANTKKDAADIGFDDAFMYKEMNLKPEERKLQSIQILREKAQKGFKLFEKSDLKDKIS